MSREEFEKLKKIAEKLKRSRLNFSKSLDYYLTSSMSDDDQFDCDFVNGAWYAYKEQQKKIDDILNLVCKLQYSSGDRILKEVNEKFNESQITSNSE